MLEDREFYYKWLAAIMRATIFSAVLGMLPWESGAQGEGGI